LAGIFHISLILWIMSAVSARLRERISDAREATLTTSCCRTRKAGYLKG
jgi:hypothetical protein